MRGDTDGCEFIQMGVRKNRWVGGKMDGREEKRVGKR
jgi:hypothetical protein